MNRFPLLWLFLGMIVGLSFAMITVMIGLNPSADDLQLLFLYMSLTGTATIVLSYLVYKLGILGKFNSLRWSLLASVVIVILLVLLNIWGTAQLMFISDHDFVLTLALLIFAGIVAVVFGLFISSTLTARIRRLSEAAESLAAGNLETRLEVSGSDELGDLTRTFNWMAEQLQEADEGKRKLDLARRELIAGVSHDLRTPLTSMRAIHEAILDGIVSDPEAIRTYVANSLSEIENLNQLIEDLFELSRLNTGQLQMEFVTTSINDLISDSISIMSALANQEGVELEMMIDPTIDPVEIAPQKFQRVIYNLIDNAIRYTPSGGKVTINAYRKDGLIYVDVHNTHSYIKEQDQQFIFNSFYRGEPSRVHSQTRHRSTGLGLAIARGIVEAHKGEIQVESAPETGTNFQIVIPRTQFSPA